MIMLQSFINTLISMLGWIFTILRIRWLFPQFVQSRLFYQQLDTETAVLPVNDTEDPGESIVDT